MGTHVKVTPDLLRGTGQQIIDVGDATHRNVEELVGTQQGDANANGNWATTTASANCENGWEQALNVIASKLGVAGDTMILNANNYHATDSSAATPFKAN